jgi:VWFA-related protein
MKSVVVTFFLLCAVAFGGVVAANQGTTDERVAVQLMLVDVLATDESGKAVRGLTKGDFQMTVEGAIAPIDTLDEICHGSTPDVPGLDPRTVLLFDYYSLVPRDRMLVLDAAATLLRTRKAPDEQVMLVALTHDLRVEQRFTRDLDELLDSLERMEYDRTLGTRQYGFVSGKDYFKNMATLMDVLAAYDGAKAVLMFSSLVTVPNEREEWYRDLATRAGVGRTVIYPTGLRGLESKARQGTRALARFAADTGGSVGERATEPAPLHGRVQQEMACRYSLGFYIDSAEARAPSDIHVSAARPGVTVRHPAQVRLWSPEETRASRMRAAFADPEKFDHPLIRTIAFHARPNSFGAWDTFVAIHAPVPIGSEEVVLNVSGELWRGDEKTKTFKKTLKIPPSESGSGTRPFTLFGDGSTKPGRYQLRVAFSSPDEKQVVGSSVQFDVPEVPTNELVLRGPLLARVDDEGLAIRADGQEPVLLRQTIGEGLSFEPLTVHEIEPTDTLLAYWNACRYRKKPDLTGATVSRNILDEHGNVVHGLGSVPLKLEGDKVQCHGALERIDPGTLEPGEYEVELVVESAGEPIAREAVPLLVD